MKKYIIIGASLILAIGILVGVYISFFAGKVWDIDYSVTPTPQVETYESLREKREAQAKINTSLYNQAIEEKNISLCDAISTEERDQCRDQVNLIIATSSWLQSSCDVLAQTGMIIECRDIISSDMAVRSQDISSCLSISDTTLQSTCRSTIEGIIYESRSLSGSLTREFCETLGSKYRSLCTRNLEARDEESVYQRALSVKDISLCESIQEIRLKSSCIDTLALSLAVERGDMSLCSKISTLDIVATCQTQVSRQSDKISYQQAIEQGDTSICEKISDSRLQNNCSDTLIIESVKKTKDISLCKSLSDVALIEACETIWQ